MSDAGSMPPPPGGGGYAAPPVGGLPLGGPPDNKLVWSILVTLFCCLPFGVVAIIKSADVNTKWNAGDAAGAQLAAAEAGKWIKWSVIAGIVSAVLFVIAWFGFFAAVIASSDTSGM